MASALSVGEEEMEYDEEVELGMEETDGQSQTTAAIPARAPNTKVTVPAEPTPKPEEVEGHLRNVNEWVVNNNQLTWKEGEEFNKTVIKDWVALTDIFKHHYSIGKFRSTTALVSGLNTLKKTKKSYDLKKSLMIGQKHESQFSENRVCLEALRCMTAILSSANQEPQANPEILADMQDVWKDLIDIGISIFLRMEANTACALLDVYCAFGKDVFCQIPDAWQKRLMVFVLGYADDADIPSITRAKFGRCIAKMVECPVVREDVGFIVDSLAVTKRNISKGENNVKCAYAWTFGNLTDVLVDFYMDAGLETKARSFVMDLLETAVKSTEVPIKARYSSCRACGNVFKWIKADMLADSEYQYQIKLIVNALIGMIGEGLDYKLRWNAARAVGQVIEDEKYLSRMDMEATCPVIKTLSKWIAQSQNYKERIQCVLSLSKVKTRAIYGAFYSHVWERLCLALARLPVEDSENMEKFRVEILLLIFNLIRVVRIDDLDGIDATVGKYYDQLTNLVLEHVAEVPLERMSMAVAAKENIEILKKKTKGTYVEGTVETLSEIIYLATSEVDGI